MKLILVTGPWSSGTTAVAGILHSLGLNGIAPFFQTNDERTKNSYESVMFREVIDQLADEQTQELKVDRKIAREELKVFRSQLESFGAGGENGEVPIFLKYPLSAMLLPQIAKVFDTRLIYVLRPLKAIEATRLRRGWAPHLGAVGAQKIYAKMFQVLVEHSIPTMVIRYPELLATRRRHAANIAAFCGIIAAREQLAAAALSVRKPDQNMKPL
jgi:hypothetical protein